MFPLWESELPPLLLASPALGVRTAHHLSGYTTPFEVVVGIVDLRIGDAGWVGASKGGGLLWTMTSRFRFSITVFLYRGQCEASGNFSVSASSM